MRNLRGIVAITLMLLVPAAASAGIEKAGTTAAGFLTLGAGADVLGMGGATLGFGNGLGAAAWNVAALGTLPGTHYVFSHATVTGESPQDWIAAGGRFGASRTRWGLSGLYQGDGSFEGRDVNNVSTGTFTASSMAIGFQIAQPVGEMATVGVGMKYASEKLGDVTGGGATFDAGLRLQAGPVGFGAAAQNVFGKMSYGGSTYDFPTNYGAGVSYTLPASGLTFALDANFPNAYYSDVRGGVEWRYRDRVALRTGYRKEVGAQDGEPLGGPTFGLGAGANGFWLDYGFLTGGASGSGQHRVGLTYRPGFMNGGTDEISEQSPRPENRSATHPTYVERAKAVRASKPAAPKPAATASRAPEGVAPQAQAPASTSKTVAPAERTSDKSNPDREPAPPAVATPAPIKDAPAAKADKSADSAPAKAASATPTKSEAAAKPAAIVTPSEAGKPAAPASAGKSEKAAASKATEAPAAAAKADAPAGDVKSAKHGDATSDKLENAPKPAPSKVEEAPKPSKPDKSESDAPAGPRPKHVKVKPGETLADIAKRWGTTVPAIMMENNMVSEKVKPGQVIVLPKKRR